MELFFKIITLRGINRELWRPDSLSKFPTIEIKRIGKAANRKLAVENSDGGVDRSIFAVVFFILGLFACLLLVPTLPSILAKGMLAQAEPVNQGALVAMGKLVGENPIVANNSSGGDYSNDLANAVIGEEATTMAKGCSDLWASTQAEGRLRLLATTTISADLLRQVGGDRVCVESLMGIGIDPHAYVARESDVRRLLHGDAIFYHGLDLEAKMADLFEKMEVNSLKPVYNLASAIMGENLIKADDSDKSGVQDAQITDVGVDPHVWFDVKLWKTAVGVVENALVELDPQHQSYYTQQAAAYKERLDDLDAEIKTEIGMLVDPVLVTSHDAFSYFGKAYGIEVVALKGINTQTQTGIKDMQHLVDFIVSRNVPVIFTESSMSKKGMETVAKAVRKHGQPLVLGDALYTDALGGADENADTYEKMVRRNLESIARHLSKNRNISLATF